MKIATILLWLGLSLAATAQIIVVPAHTDDVDIFDYNGDDAGDLLYSLTGQIQIVGENGTDGFEHRYLLPFVPDEFQRAAIANAQSVALDLELWRATNVAGCQVDIYGLPDRTAVRPVSSDFEAPATLVVNGAITGERLRGNCSFDVTAFANAEAARGPANVIMFRLQMSPNVPNGDGLFNQYIFTSASTTTPPKLTVLSGSASIRASIELKGDMVTISWHGGLGPYRIEKTTDLSSGDWVLVDTTDTTSVTLNATDSQAFYRVSGQ